MSDRYTTAAEALKAECVVQDFDAEAAASLLRAQFAEYDAAVAELVKQAQIARVFLIQRFGYEKKLEAALAALEGR